MSALKAEIIERTLRHVQLVELKRETAKWWNARRRPDDTPTFCGWYWLAGPVEAGPFHSRSAALRDAYYRFVLRREVPSVRPTGKSNTKLTLVKPVGRRA